MNRNGKFSFWFTKYNGNEEEDAPTFHAEQNLKSENDAERLDLVVTDVTSNNESSNKVIAKISDQVVSQFFKNNYYGLVCGAGVDPVALICFVCAIDELEEKTRSMVVNMTT